MCKELFFWATEYLNYFSLIFFGIKLFLKKYDVQTGRKGWVDNVIIFVASMPVVWIAADNYRFAKYSTISTYFAVIFICCFMVVLTKNKAKRIISFASIYIHSMRLLDLLVVAIVLEVNQVSRYFNWDLINMGIDRSVFLIFLSISYYLFYCILKDSFFVDYLYENRFYRWLLCIYTYLGVVSFGRVYRFEYTSEIIEYWTFYLVCAFLVFGFFVFYFVKAKSEERDRILNMRNDMLESNYSSLQKAYDENRMLSHDFKNHMLAVNQLIVDNEYEKAEEYIKAYIDHMVSTKLRSNSGCNIIDIILNSKIAEAIDKSIDFDYEIEYIGHISIEDIDMCSLLANLLDNSIEACEKIEGSHKWIKFYLKRKNNMLLIVLKNSIEEKQSKKRNFFSTDKFDLVLHGLGIKSIEKVVKKCEGYIEYKVQKTSFEVFVSLPVE